MKEKLTEVTEISIIESYLEKKISINAKARLQSFKESENTNYDQKISKLASEATNVLFQ